MLTIPKLWVKLLKPSKVERVSIMSTSPYVPSIAEPALTDAAKPNFSLSGIISVMDLIGKDFVKGLSYLVTFAPVAASIASVIYPPAVPEAKAAVGIIDLIQKAVILVEANYAASGIATETGPKKLADVLLLVQETVVQILGQYGVKADTNYVTNLINIVVGILNIHRVTPTA